MMSDSLKDFALYLEKTVYEGKVPKYLVTFWPPDMTLSGFVFGCIVSEEGDNLVYQS